MIIPLDRRQFPRAEVRWPITIHTDQGLIDAKLGNLGAEGAYIYCKKPPKPRDFVAMTIEPPHRAPLKITAKVVWASTDLALGMGVRFVEISEKDRQFLSKILPEQLPSQYERGKPEK